MRRVLQYLLISVSLVVPLQVQAQSTADWPHYGRTAGGTRYAPLAQITRENVAQLTTAWTFRTGELEHVRPGSSLAGKMAFEATPLVVDGVMYFSTASARVFALEAATGRELWRYDSQLDQRLAYAEGASRGVSYWRSAGSPKEARILLGTLDARLIALDAATGRPCADFGESGVIRLAAGVARAFPGRYTVTSPPAIVGDVVVVGSAIGDNGRFDLSSGVVRGYDVRTGKLLWQWDPIPRAAGSPGNDSWQGPDAHKTGAANVWSVISADTKRGWVYLPTSCPSPDFYGGLRLGDNRFANSVVALEAKTGKVQWHFQVVHHDIWDYDIAAQPVLFPLRRDGQNIDAVAVGTKTGQVFILDRQTGEPLFPVEERPVPASDVKGEVAAKSQPFSSLPQLGLQKAQPWGPTPETQAQAEREFAKLRYEGIFTPASVRGTLVAPANVGGINWSGMSIDVDRQLLVTNVNRVASIVRLIPRKEYVPGGDNRLGEEFASQAGTPCGMARRVFRQSESLLLATAPPWGTLAAIDLTTGQLQWEVPLGTMADPAVEPRATAWGSPNLGGAITTAGGLTFVAASLDGHLRAFDTESGQELWRGKLPAGGQATPMTFADSDGKQFVVIAAGGHARMGTVLGDYVVAYALP